MFTSDMRRRNAGKLTTPQIMLVFVSCATVWGTLRSHAISVKRLNQAWDIQGQLFGSRNICLRSRNIIYDQVSDTLSLQANGIPTCCWYSQVQQITNGNPALIILGGVHSRRPMTQEACRALAASCSKFGNQLEANLLQP